MKILEPRWIWTFTYIHNIYIYIYIYIYTNIYNGGSFDKRGFVKNGWGCEDVGVVKMSGSLKQCMGHLRISRSSVPMRLREKN